MTQEVRKCPLCGDEVPLAQYRSHVSGESHELQQYALDLIRRTHPDWIEDDGACAKCMEYYERL